MFLLLDSIKMSNSYNDNKKCTNISLEKKTGYRESSSSIHDRWGLLHILKPFYTYENQIFKFPEKENKK